VGLAGAPSPILDGGMTARSTEIVAVPPAPLTDWLRTAVPQLPVGDGPVAVERISGGH
jgi:hypothetical protein